MRDGHVERRAVVLALAIAVGLLALAPAEGRTRAPECVSPPAKGQRWTWTRGATIRVNISPEFSPLTGAGQAIESAFRHWQAAGDLRGNGSGVTFVITHEAEPVSGPETFQVSYGRIPGTSQARTLLASRSIGLLSAVCTIDRRVTEPAALSNVMAHEIGHTFGLAECDDCPAGRSVMTRYSGDYNDTNTGRNAPSDCDNTAVRAGGEY